MARYKHYDLNQTKMIPLSDADQIIEGSCEYALNKIIEEQLDLSVFEHATSHQPPATSKGRQANSK